MSWSFFITKHLEKNTKTTQHCTKTNHATREVNLLTSKWHQLYVYILSAMHRYIYIEQYISKHRRICEYINIDKKVHEKIYATLMCGIFSLANNIEREWQILGGGDRRDQCNGTSIHRSIRRK